MSAHKKSYEYDAIRWVPYRPAYNDENNLSFVMKGDKHYALLSDAMLDIEFSVNENYVVDNQLLDKLFDSVEIILGKDSITRRSITNEHIWNSFCETTYTFIRFCSITKVLMDLVHVLGCGTFSSCRRNSRQNLSKIANQ